MTGFVIVNEDFKESADILAYRKEVESSRRLKEELHSSGDPISLIKHMHIDENLHDKIGPRIEDPTPPLTIDQLLEYIDFTPIQAARELGFTYKLGSCAFPFVQLTRFRCAVIDLMKEPKNRKHNTTILYSGLLTNDVDKLNLMYLRKTGNELSEYIRIKSGDIVSSNQDAEIFRLAVISGYLRINDELEESADAKGFQKAVRKLVD
jgi:hypothetical protein